MLAIYMIVVLLLLAAGFWAIVVYNSAKLVGKGAMAVSKLMVNADTKNKADRIYDSIKGNSEIMDYQFEVEDFNNFSALDFGKKIEDKNVNIGKFSKINMSISELIKNNRGVYYNIFTVYTNSLKKEVFVVDDYIKLVKELFTIEANNNFKNYSVK